MIEGGCRCGESRYRLAIDTLPPTYCCHCLFCQSWTGSAFSQQALLPAEAMEATGPIVSFSMARDDGHVSTQYVCGTCHARLWNENTRRPGLAIVRAGTLDDSASLSAVLHIWTRRKQPWVVIDPSIPSYPENAPAEAFAPLLER